MLVAARRTAADEIADEIKAHITCIPWLAHGSAL
jgi:hypothetical protein